MGKHRGEIFRNCPDQPWGPPILLYIGTESLPGVKRPGHGIDHPPPSNAEVKERVELYLYSPSGPSWPVPGWPLPLPLHGKTYSTKQLTTSPPHFSSTDNLHIRYFCKNFNQISSFTPFCYSIHYACEKVHCLFNLNSLQSYKNLHNI